MKRQNKSPKGILASMLLVLAVGGCIFFLWPSGPVRLVEDFYEYESGAEFGKSWDLLSSEMKSSGSRIEAIMCKIGPMFLCRIWKWKPFSMM